ncbi:MAG: TIGR03668 family PPOX class F420-dependent oxidoreductase [Chloroflexi bacterium]|nr:TIGR03668 family PPOX class F420-dependent oxidoreductase [Chloroflexota bacterium]
MFDAWQLHLVESCRIAHLGTLARDGRPHLVPVCFAHLDGQFAIVVDEKPKRPGELARVRNIARDPRVTLLFDHYDDADWTRLAWVRVEGEARVLARGDSWPAALVALRARYPQYRAMALEGLPLIAITPTRVVTWRAAGAPAGAPGPR